MLPPYMAVADEFPLTYGEGDPDFNTSANLVKGKEGGFFLKFCPQGIRGLFL